MDGEKISIKLTVAHAKCIKCGFERILYFTPEYWYGERIVYTKDGKLCAYANLMEENIIPELNEICTSIFQEEKINISKEKRGYIVSQIYAITCDDLEGQAVENTPSWKCNNCLNGKMEEDKIFGEQLMNIEMPYITHKAWDLLDYTQKVQRIKGELTKQGYI